MQKTFEETYPLYTFSELVRLAIRLGELIGGLRRGSRNAAKDAAPAGDLALEGAD